MGAASSTGAASAASSASSSASPSSSSSSPVPALDSSSASPFATFELEHAADVVDGIPEDRRIVLLGESTHGTEEFYRIRAAITKRLIEERGFTAVVFEADWPLMEAANEFIHRKRTTPFPAKIGFPKWMWHNQCMEDFFSWAQRKPPAKTPELFGMDCYSLFESKKAVIRFLETHDASFAAEVKERLAYLDRFEDGHAYGDAMVNGSLSRIAGHIQEVLTQIQARLQWGSDKYTNCTDVERLSAEQNCEVVISADEYYRKMVSEPPGSQASWNARDQHMTTTLMRIQAHLKDPKIVVWAHNSHVGDSTATDRGGLDFERNETWNLGQMVRATFGREKVWIVGQYTHGGTVTASDNWGGEHEAKPLRAALPESYEGQLHELQRSTLKHAHPFYFGTAATPLLFQQQEQEVNGSMGDPSATTSSTTSTSTTSGSGRSVNNNSSSEAQSDATAAEAMVQAALSAKDPIALSLVGLLHPSRGPQLQRWVGVSYRPDTERQSHYGALELGRCYDQVVFVDETRALEPVRPKEQVARGLGMRGHGAERGAIAGAGGGAQLSATNRLLKEYRRLLRQPAPGIEAHPLETNILEWHFLLRCDAPPYGPQGEYHGALEFPPAYPMAPPAFKVFTPSGRFEPGVRLCMSMSDYHPESWNPSWSVETLLVGLQSFMYEESEAIGSLRNVSASERQRLAAQSHAFNMRNGIYRELFGSESSTGGGEGGAQEAEEEVHESVCRFCFSSEGELISPCMCKGSNEWVHLACLRKWQENVVLSQPTHPKYQTNIDQVCNVCLEPFTGIGQAPSRHEQIMSYTGAEVAALVAAGNLLVSTRESSRENLEIIAQHPEVKDRVMPWTKAVFLILSSGRGGTMAASMSMPSDKPPADIVELSTRQRQQWAALASRNSSTFRIRHFDGGPMQRHLPIAIAHVAEPSAAAWATQHSESLSTLAPGWVYGHDFDAVATAACKSSEVRQQRKKDAGGGGDGDSVAAASPPPPMINVVWGCGGWGHTQILAEIARGGWGLVTVEDYLAIRPDASMEMDWLMDFEWTRICPLAKLAPRSAYTQRR